jgi:epithelial splicing regulatory protein 1/2
MTPDIQIQHGPNGRPSGEAYVTFATRTEAERAVTERNRKLFGNRLVDIHMA